MPSPRVSAARLESLWQQARDPVFLLSADLKLVWANKAWEELTGHSFEAAAGLICQSHGPTRAGDLAGLGGSLSPPPEAVAGHPCASPTLIIHPSGERRWRRLDYWPLVGADGDLLGLFAILCAPESHCQFPESRAQRLRVELLEVRERLHERYGFDTLIGRGPAHRRLVDQVAAAAATDVPVLLFGEPGTGKRTAARAIHQQGRWRHGALLPFDCSALPPEVLERELFGKMSDGVAPRFSLPEGSTLLIGDILDLTRDLQDQLAQADRSRIRLLAMTGSDPEAALAEGRLRADFYFALTTLVIRLRPLRDRLEEFPVLVQHMLERANLRGGRQRTGFTEDAIGALLAYDWPGNLRELARVIDDAHDRGDGDQITVDDLPAGIRGHLGGAYLPPPLPPPIAPLDELLTQVERRLIESALIRSRQNKSKAAEMLGISRPRLYRRIKELNLPDVPEADDAAMVDGNGHLQ